MCAFILCTCYIVAWVCWYLLLFFKQKTAYEMRISDWSSDVCSADLRRHAVITIAFQRGYGQLCRHPDLARNSRSGCLSSLLLSARNIRIKNRRGFSRFLYQTFDFAYQRRISRNGLLRWCDDLFLRGRLDRQSVVEGKSGSGSVSL